jgi:hypothetical protein
MIFAEAVEMLHGILGASSGTVTVSVEMSNHAPSKAHCWWAVGSSALLLSATRAEGNALRCGRDLPDTEVLEFNMLKDVAAHYHKSHEFIVVVRPTSAVKLKIKRTLVPVPRGAT